MLPIEVETAAGWQARGTLFGSGPFAYKTTAYALDVSDVEGETLRLRLPVPVNFWVLNSVAVDYGEQPPVETREVQTSTERDARGREARRLLSATDGEAVVMAEKGDHADLAYPAPPARPGQARTVLLRISGHYDIHLPAEGEPQEALLQRVLFEPGYTLRFALIVTSSARPRSASPRGRLLRADAGLGPAAGDSARTAQVRPGRCAAPHPRADARVQPIVPALLHARQGPR